jgi:hypothetical protein
MFAALVIAAALAAQQPATGAECAALFAQHFPSDLALSYEAFDQTEGSGFRVLAARRCEREAADLIVEYLVANKATQRSLRWHVAQLRATHGDTPRAIAYARSVLAEHENFDASPLRWNDYVLATIAFLERDRDALVRHRDNVAAGAAAHAGNALNLKLLDRLIRHYGSSYAEATAAGE